MLNYEELKTSPRFRSYPDNFIEKIKETILMNSNHKLTLEDCHFEWCGDNLNIYPPLKEVLSL